MINTLKINNFKSIKNLRLHCKKINIFIGEPNTGKSNILEALGALSFGYYGQYSGNNLRNFVRFEIISNLFYDENLENVVIISADDKILEIKFENGNFTGEYRVGQKHVGFNIPYSGSFSISFPKVSVFKFYKFSVRKNFPIKVPGSLLPPFGDNLLVLLMGHKELKSTASQIFDQFGFKLAFKPQEDKIEILKQYEDIFISFPYSLVSDTLQRIVFYLTAISSNKDSVLVFEEPESHAFPYYTKLLAERVALDQNNNQYFISTHNHYFLLSTLEKSPKEDISIFITYFEDYETKVKALSEKEMEEVLEREIDVFFNIEQFLEGSGVEE